jgi:hypothetical protein
MVKKSLEEKRNVPVCNKENENDHRLLLSCEILNGSQEMLIEICYSISLT